ncbi:MAG: FAD-binding domain-containing protein [Chlamydiota bacterium]
MNVAAVWFKRDLRLRDHAPLRAALQNHDRVVLFYVFESEYWDLPFTSFRQWSFFYDCLLSLEEEIVSKGGLLTVFTCSAQTALQALHGRFCLQALYAHEETGGEWTFQRDIAVRRWCQKERIPFRESPTNGVVRGLRSRDDWAKIHHKRMQKPLIEAPEDLTQARLFFPSDPLPLPESFPDYFPEEKTQKGGRRQAQVLLQSFCNKRAERYLQDIANPSAWDSSSRLSAFLSVGALSVKEVFQEIARAKNNTNSSWFRRALAAFSSRLHWRCHFVQKLEDDPSIEHTAMNRACDTLRSREDQEVRLRAWKEGKTGYPLVDACMRALRIYGWVPFRMRAMVMSFASYDLWLDWRDTSAILGALFTDYEPGIHHAQVQMQSGTTGINALRMYDPTKQAKTHDPQGHFIRMHIPELRSFPTEWIHEPFSLPPLVRLAENISMDSLYASPIVEHKTAIRRARKIFSSILYTGEFQKEARRVYKKHGSRKKWRENKGKAEEN